MPGAQGETNEERLPTATGLLSHSSPPCPAPTAESRKSKQQATDSTPFTITHNPGNPPLAKWLTQYMPVLHSSSRMRKALPAPLIVDEWNCHNLRSMPMQSKTPILMPQDDGRSHGCHKCSRKCMLCKEHLPQTTTFTNVRSKNYITLIEINQNITLLEKKPKDQPVI